MDMLVGYAFFVPAGRLDRISSPPSHLYPPPLIFVGRPPAIQLRLSFLCLCFLTTAFLVYNCVLFVSLWLSLCFLLRCASPPCLYPFVFSSFAITPSLPTTTRLYTHPDSPFRAVSSLVLPLPRCFSRAVILSIRAPAMLKKVLSAFLSPLHRSLVSRLFTPCLPTTARSQCTSFLNSSTRLELSNTSFLYYPCAPATPYIQTEIDTNIHTPLVTKTLQLTANFRTRGQSDPLQLIAAGYRLGVGTAVGTAEGCVVYQLGQSHHA